MGQSVLHSVVYLSSLAVVKSIECSDEVSCDSSDSFESDTFANISVFIYSYFYVIHFMSPFLD